jgi:hypothetical protein
MFFNYVIPISLHGSTESDLSYFCIKISSAAQVTLLKPSFSRSKRANENKTRCSSGKYISKFLYVDGTIANSFS